MPSAFSMFCRSLSLFAPNLFRKVQPKCLPQLFCIADLKNSFLNEKLYIHKFFTLICLIFSSNKIAITAISNEAIVETTTMSQRTGYDFFSAG